MSPYKFQHERQQILDYLNAHPGTIAIELARALGAHKNTIKTRILRMEDLGEVRRKATVHYCISDKSGKRVASLAYSLFATVEHAEFVDQGRPMIERQAEKASKKPRAAKPAKPTEQQRVIWEGGSCKNIWADRPTIRNQGGQGGIGINPRGYCAILGE